MDDKVFISYKRDDYDQVMPIRERLESDLGFRCWVDVAGIESDAQFAEVIIEAINKCEIFLFMYSERHLNITDFDKDWTVRELSFAERKGKRIVFINIDDSPLSDWFGFMYGNKQQINVSDQAAMKHLTSDLKKWLGIDDSPLKIYKVSKSQIPQLIDEFISVPDYINIDESDLKYLYEAEGDIYYSIIPLSLSDSRFKIAFEQLRRSLDANKIFVRQIAMNIKLPENVREVNMREVSYISKFAQGLNPDVDIIWGLSRKSIRNELFVIIS